MIDKNHEKFKEHVHTSHIGVDFMFKELKTRRYDVKKAPPATIAKEHKDWKEHTDDGDLYINGNQRLEVKSLSKQFTTERSSYPYPDMIVCAKHSFEDSIPKPLAYLLLNKDKTAFAVVMSEDKPSWTVKRITDYRYNPPRSQDCYLCPIRKIRFYKMH
jgi:hypothetical protein